MILIKMYQNKNPLYKTKDNNTFVGFLWNFKAIATLISLIFVCYYNAKSSDIDLQIHIIF